MQFFKRNLSILSFPRLSYLPLLFALYLVSTPTLVFAEDNSRVLSRVIAALDSGKPENMSVLTPQNIGKLSVGNPDIEKIIKRQAIESLLSRFEISDWQDWPRAYAEVDGKPSDAWIFLTDLSLINEPLGNYLANAGYVLHRLYVTSMKGMPLDFDQALAELSRVQRQNREMLEAATFSYSPNFLRDEVFPTLFLHYQGKLFAIYVRYHPGEIRAQWAVLKGIGTHEPGAEFREGLLLHLNFLATEAGPETRNIFFRLEREGQVVTRFAEGSSDLREAVANVYLLGAVDEFRRGDLSMARARLKESKETYAGLELQTQVAALLTSREKGQPEPGRDPEEENRTLFAERENGVSRAQMKSSADLESKQRSLGSFIRQEEIVEEMEETGLPAEPVGEVPKKYLVTDGDNRRALVKDENVGDVLERAETIKETRSSLFERPEAAERADKKDSGIDLFDDSFSASELFDDVQKAKVEEELDRVSSGITTVGILFFIGIALLLLLPVILIFIRSRAVERGLQSSISNLEREKRSQPAATKPAPPSKPSRSAEPVWKVEEDESSDDDLDEVWKSGNQ